VLLLAVGVDPQRLDLEFLAESGSNAVVPLRVLLGLVAVAGHSGDDVGDPDLSDTDGEVQVRGPGRILPGPGRVGRTGELVRPVIRIPVADAPDVLVPEQPPERVRCVLLRTGVGRMEAMPVDPVATLGRV
jgi:hypothetical protein